MPIDLAPVDLKELSETLARANERGEQISSINLCSLNRVQEHIPADMTVTAEAGITLAALQAQLQRHGQWLPIDPPHAERAAINEILATNASGPRRFGYGTVRDYAIGLRVALAGGTIIKSGGKVVKNVAGYDLAKLFIGSRGTLGVIVEATFKLRPLPEREVFIRREFTHLDDATRFADAVLESKLNPVVLDLHHLARSSATTPNPFVVMLGFAGAREDVECDLSRAAELGATTSADLEYETQFWVDESKAPVQKRSVLPSRLAETLREIGAAPFVARAGNGIVFYRGGPAIAKADSPRHLFQRIKDTYDPKHIFPSLPT